MSQQALHVRPLTEWRAGGKGRLTFGSLKACRPCSYDLTDAMSLPFDQAICEVDQHRGSSHAVHQLDVLIGRLTVLPCVPATSATLRCMQQDGSAGMITGTIAVTQGPMLCDSNRWECNALYSYSLRP